MRLKVEALKKICAECRRKAGDQPVECEATRIWITREPRGHPCDYKFCERVYVYEIVDVR